MEALAVLLAIAVLAFPFVVIGLLVATRNRLRLAEAEIAAFRETENRFDGRLAELKREVRQLREAIGVDGAAAPFSATEPSAPAAEPPARDEAPFAPEPPPIPAAAFDVPPPLVVPPLPRDLVKPPAAPPPLPAGRPDLVEAPVALEEREPPAPPPPPAAIPPPPIPGPPPVPKPAFDWEGLVGVKLFSWAAGVMLVVAAVYFLRYSIQAGWLTPPIRMAMGLAVGIALLVVCELKAARKYPVTANALDGAAIAILFSTFFASHALWKLVETLPTFVFLFLVAAVAVLLSIRRDSLFIALLGLVGGFSTPYLLSTGENRPFGLFGYLLLLNVGLAWVAHKKRWPILTALSVVFTAVYQWGWVAKFLSADQLPLSLGIFAIFPIVTYAALLFGENPGAGFSPALSAPRGGDGAEEEASATRRLFSQTATLAAVLPLAFAFYLAVVPAYGARWGLLFGFLFVLDVGLFAVALGRGPAWLHALGGAATLGTLALWLALSFEGSDAWPAILAFTALFVVFYLAAPLVHARWASRRSSDREAGGPDPFDEEWFSRSAYVAPLLFFAFPALAALEPKTASPLALFGVLFVLMALVAAYAVFRGEGAIHFLGAFFALAAEAVWSAKHLAPERLHAALALYGVFALFYLGVPLAARRLGKELTPKGSATLLLFVSLGLLFFLAAGPIADTALWGLALLLAVLNVGLFVEGAAGRGGVLTLLGVLLSWVLLAVWWATAHVTLLLVPALVVVAGFSLLTLGGNAFAARRAEAAGGEEPELFGGGLYLGLVGHLFLVFVASQPGLAVPPWPLLGVLAVVDLAIGVAALFAKRGELFVAALVGTAIVLLVFEGTNDAAPWPTVALLASVAAAVFALGWLLLARRVAGAGEAGARFLSRIGGGAVAALFGGEVVAIFASLLPGAPALPLLVGVHAAFAVAFLALAAVSERHVLAALAVVPAFVAVAAWRASPAGEAADGWKGVLLFGGVLWALFVAYPLVLGARAKGEREPYLAAVLASVPFFFLARRALLDGGLGDVIGALPVLQAAAMALLLVRLLKLEPPGKRTLGRLALVAGAALAFVTVAIPLQLSKEWITVAWALEGAALAWLYGRIAHKGLLGFSTALLVAVFARLALNKAVLAYHPRSATPILNWYLYTYLVSAAAMFVAARFLSRTDEALHDALPKPSRLLRPLGTILLFLLVNIEIADFYATGPTLSFELTGGGDWAKGLTYTLAWALFAVGLLAAGVATGSRATRLASIVLLTVTVLKAGFLDLAHLDGLFRVASIAGVAVALILVAVALQKFVLVRSKAEGA